MDINSKDSIEHAILYHLIHDKEYRGRVLPHLKREYFDTMVIVGGYMNAQWPTVYSLIDKYFEQYRKTPTTNVLRVMLDEVGNLTERTYADALEIVNSLVYNAEQHTENTTEFLIDATENWAQDMAIHGALMSSIDLAKSETSNEALPNRHKILPLLQDALAVSFTRTSGNDFFEDAEARYEWYHRDINKIPFDIDYFNTITNGGFERKTLNVIMGGVHVGKSLTMCHLASANLLDGWNVLYLTMEMSEENISRRIEANLLDVPMDELDNLTKDEYLKRIKSIRNKTVGRLKIKEYPTSVANVNHFRALLDDLEMKDGFKPDVIYVDYINICASVRYGGGTKGGLYDNMKSVAEELRGMAVEKNVAVWSATQTNREGFKSSNPGMADVGESWGIPATSDFYIVLVQTEEHARNGLYLVTQLKNRYGNVDKSPYYFIGVEKNKMRLTDESNNIHNQMAETSSTNRTSSTQTNDVSSQAYSFSV